MIDALEDLLANHSKNKGKTRDPGALSQAFWETVRLLDLLDSQYVLLYFKLNRY